MHGGGENYYRVLMGEILTFKDSFGRNIGMCLKALGWKN
jgi:hypothetical protein